MTMILIMAVLWNIEVFSIVYLMIERLILRRI
jgi:hypothetical protein